jgi:hypothetical protein
MNRTNCTYVRRIPNDKFEVVAKHTYRISKIMGRFSDFNQAIEQAIKVAKTLNFEHIHLGRY